MSDKKTDKSQDSDQDAELAELDEEALAGASGGTSSSQSPRHFGKKMGSPNPAVGIIVGKTK